MRPTFSPVNSSNAHFVAQPYLDMIQKKLGMIPNLLGILANNPKALQSYLALEEFFTASGLNEVEQQVVLMTVSMENKCNYCVAAHSAISAMNKLDKKVIQQLKNGEALENRKLEGLRTFTKRIVSAKGWVDNSDLELFMDYGYSIEHVLAVIIGVSMKTLSNYTNHIAQTEIDEPFKAFLNKP
jgi:AhpD family alkylhydroperoxidase